jgi:hypothetical protein
MPSNKFEETFPNIRKEGFQITSEETLDYNCFAHAVGDKSQWWSPVESKGYYWHPKLPKNLSVENFCELYKREGQYLPCDNGHLEAGFEKIAIYADGAGNVTHAARQTPDGKWTSKLGDWEDIEHNTLAAIEGDFYGKAVQFLKRAVT